MTRKWTKCDKIEKKDEDGARKWNIKTRSGRFGLEVRTLEQKRRENGLKVI